jgi:hypothetical protein
MNASFELDRRWDGPARHYRHRELRRIKRLLTILGRMHEFYIRVIISHFP